MKKGTAAEVLQDIQRRFDASRGFTNLPHAQAEPTSEATPVDDLRSAEFTLLALLGEVGEIANKVKKHIRGGRKDDRDVLRDSIKEEIADVQSYLFKLSNIARIKLGEAYLEKVAVNAHRFPSLDMLSGRPTVAIAGAPGTGKTTVVKSINRCSGNTIRTYIEQYLKNPFLPSLFSDADPFDADANQNWFLSKLAEFLSESDDISVLIDQDPTAIAMVYSRYFRNYGLLSDQEYTNHLELLADLEIRYSRVLSRRHVIVLEATVPVLSERCSEKFKVKVDPLFLRDISEYFKLLYDRLPNTVFIDASADRPTVLRRVKKAIAKAQAS